MPSLLESLSGRAALHRLYDLLRNQSEIIDPGLRVARQAVNGKTDSIEPCRLACSRECFDTIFWRASEFLIHSERIRKRTFPPEASSCG